MQVALAWLLHRSPNMLLIPRHLVGRPRQLTLSPQTFAELNGIAAAAGAVSTEPVTKGQEYAG
jgi:hypothetical protein